MRRPVGPFKSPRSHRVASALVAAVLVASLAEVVLASQVEAATTPGAGEYVPLTQTRIVDSRIAQGLSGPVVAGTPVSFQVSGQGGVPTSGVSAVAMTVTLVSPSAYSWVTVWAQGDPAPGAANLMANLGQTVANTVITKLGASTGQASISLGTGTAHVLVDIQGYYTTSSATTAAATFVPLPMNRVYDSRSTGQTVLGADATRTVQVLGKGGVPPSGVAAVVLNVTAVQPTVGTWLEVWPGGTRPNPGSTVNSPPAPSSAAAMVQTGVATDGTVSVYNAHGSTNFILDVEGYYLTPTSEAAAFYVPIVPRRILDTRTGLNTNGKTVPLATGGVLSVPIRGVVGAGGGSAVVPNSSNVTAAVLSVTAAQPSVAGYLTAFPEGTVRQPASFANYDPASQPNVLGSVIAKIGDTGRVSVYAFGGTHIVVDLQGYFQSAPPPEPPAPGISTSAFTQNGWAATGTTGSVSLTMTSGTAPAVRQYKWALDDPGLSNASLVNVGTDNATGTVSGLNPGDGWHTLYVQAVNTAANASPVTAYTFGVGVGITGPTEGTKTARYVRLKARASTAYQSVTWNYRRSASDAWAVIPADDVTNGGSALTSWPVAAPVSGSSVVAPELVWDARTTLAGVDGTTQVQACFTPTGGGTAVCNADAKAPTVTLDKINAGGAGASTSLPVGNADLLTGNLTVSADDVNVPAAGSDLTLGRTFNTLDPTRTADPASQTASVFGPGWTTALPVDSASSPWSGLAHRGNVVTVSDTDGIITTFAKNASGAWKPTGEDADTGLTLTPGTAGTFGPANWTVGDLDGNATKFAPTATLTHAATATNPNPYRVDVVTQPGSAQTTTYSYDTSNRPTQILAPVPAGSTCSGATPLAGTWTGGCKALYLTYGTSGNASGRLVAVTLRSTTAAGAEVDVDVACYSYDANTRLASMWDPRDGADAGGNHPIACTSTQYRPTTYTYDSAGRIATVTPAGLAPHTIGYDSSGRVITVSRTHSASFNNGATETTQVVYGVPTTADSGDPAFRPDLSGTAIAAWGQAEAPVTATAVFSPGHAASTSDLRGASVSYLNAEGRTVNSADYAGSGAAGWHIDTTEYDERGNTVRQLSAKNREEALDPSSLSNPDLNLPSDSVAAAAALSTVNVYAYEASTGTSDLTDTFGPYHLVTLPDGTTRGARAHTHTTYDTGSEIGHPAGPLLHLPITVTTGASLSAQPVATNETDVRTTTNAYALSSTDTTGWTFRTPMKVTTDPSGLNISQISRFDPVTGAVIESRQPRSAGGDAGTTVSIYYTAGANAADSACGSKPAWATLLCVTKPAAQPGVAGLPGLVTKRITAYDYLSRPTTTTETVTDASGTNQVRTNSVQYRIGGYSTDTDTTSVTGGLGAAVPSTTTTYDANTGLATKVQAAATGTQAATAAITGYDDFGRVTLYTENDQAGSGQGNTTTTEYVDNSGLVASVTDAKGTTSYAYNQNGEFRDKQTTLTVTGVGAFTGSYDAEGALATQTWPNGVTKTIVSDETGDAASQTTAGNGRTWLAEKAASNIHGQTRFADYAAGGEYGGSLDYAYDAAGRLGRARDTLAATNACTTRTYAFDNDGNRTNNKEYSPGSDGACQEISAASNVSHTYDIADRLQATGTDAGLAYDAFGRITTLPSADTANAGGNATIGYYTNDLVRSQAQGSSTLAWSLDANGRLSATSGSASRTNHYGDASSDSPSWIAENVGGSNWSRNVTDLTGNLAATITQSSTLTWQVTNMHGDVVATAANTDLEPSSYQLTDEYGVVAAGYSTSTRYGWLGGKHRSQDDLAGLVLMGVRLYTPTLGRFLQVDPVPGGSASSYAYPNDPVNMFDLDGRRWCGMWCPEDNALTNFAKQSTLMAADLAGYWPSGKLLKVRRYWGYAKAIRKNPGHYASYCWRNRGQCALRAVGVYSSYDQWNATKAAGRQFSRRLNYHGNRLGSYTLNWRRNTYSRMRRTYPWRSW